jgi:hypothetical protein
MKQNFINDNVYLIYFLWHTGKILISYQEANFHFLHVNLSIH